tara:strand:+ start:436 stop:663 length:228 start_codon:yes stop_codon:yes gene_type:complete
MSLIPIPLKEIYESNLSYWLEGKTIDVKNTKVIKIQTIINSEKCSVDSKETCKEYTKGDFAGKSYCIPVEPIRFK